MRRFPQTAIVRIQLLSAEERLVVAKTLSADLVARTASRDLLVRRGGIRLCFIGGLLRCRSSLLRCRSSLLRLLPGLKSLLSRRVGCIGGRLCMLDA